MKTNSTNRKFIHREDLAKELNEALGENRYSDKVYEAFHNISEDNAGLLTVKDFAFDKEGVLKLKQTFRKVMRAHGFSGQPKVFIDFIEGEAVDNGDVLLSYYDVVWEWNPNKI